MAQIMEVIERLHDLLGKVKDLYDNRVLSNLRRICRTCLVRIPTDMVTTERFIAEQERIIPPPPPPPRTKWTRRVPHPVPIGHAASLTTYQSDTPRPSPRANRTRRVPHPAGVSRSASSGPKRSASTSARSRSSARSTT